DLPDVSDGSAERDIDRLFRRFLRQGPYAADGQPLAGRALAQIVGPHNADFPRLFLFGRQAPEIELTVELDPELAGLGPADDASNGADADDIDREYQARGNRLIAFDESAHRRDVAKLHFQRLTRNLGDRPPH